ncbi:hypothetical protein BG004_004820 [Podila humilis]|nr:hypothetical protein BG004_004820 [Podila humilis]
MTNNNTPLPPSASKLAAKPHDISPTTYLHQAHISASQDPESLSNPMSDNHATNFMVPETATTAHADHLKSANITPALSTDSLKNETVEHDQSDLQQQHDLPDYQQHDQLDFQQLNNNTSEALADFPELMAQMATHRDSTVQAFHEISAVLDEMNAEVQFIFSEFLTAQYISIEAELTRLEIESTQRLDEQARLKHQLTEFLAAMKNACSIFG